MNFQLWLGIEVEKGVSMATPKTLGSDLGCGACETAFGA